MYQSSLVNEKTYNMMKKIIPMIVAILFAMTTIGQTVKFDVITDPVLPGTVEIGINFADFTDVGSITLFIDYDLDLMQYAGTGEISLLGGTFLITESDGSNHALAIAWANFVGASFIDETIVLPFNFNGGFSTDLLFLHNLPSKCEIATVQGVEINATYIDNELVPDLSNPDGTAVLGSAVGIAGANVTIPVSILDAGGFDGVASSMSLFIAYDADKLIYTGVTDNVLGFIVSGGDGIVSLSKSGTTPMSFPLADPVVKLTFDYLGGGTADVAWKSGSVITDNDGSILITEFEDGEVTLDPNFLGKLTIAKVASAEAEEVTLPDPPGGTIYDLVPVEVPVTAEGFSGIDVGEISLKIKYDTEKLTWDGYVANQFSGWTFGINTEEGEISLSVISQAGLTIAPGDLVTLKFLYLNGLADITFEPSTFVNDVEALPVPTELVDGYVSPFVVVDAKVFLEGPFPASATLMNTTLNTLGVIPTTQPYSNAPWSYGGSETLASIPAGVVDWILVELRDKNDNTNIIATRAGFVLDNGDIVDLDGVSPLSFPGGITPDEYFIAVRHRNHLDVISENAVLIDANSSNYDFTLQSDGQKSVNGIFVMFAGDTDGDLEVTITDRSLVTFQLGNDGYLKEDIDLDGEITITDRGKLTGNLGNNSNLVP